MNERSVMPAEHRRDAVIGLLAGPVVWFACFLLLYLLTGSGCSLNYATTNIGGINTLRLLALMASLVAALVVAWSVLLTFRRWRDTRRMIDAAELETRQRQEFLQVAGFVLGLVSLVGIVWLAATVVLNPIC